MKPLSELNVELVPIEKLIPFWRNPRNNDKAIEKVIASIKEYGYQAPILVDKKMTIIAGHTRYQALKQLGVENVPVIISDMTAKQAREYRIVDNRTSEYATWSNDLTLELKDFAKPEMLELFFPDIKLETNFADAPAPVSAEKIETIATALADQYSAETRAEGAEPMVEFPCPHCLETIRMAVRDLMKERNWTV